MFDLLMTVWPYVAIAGSQILFVTYLIQENPNGEALLTIWLGCLVFPLVIYIAVILVSCVGLALANVGVANLFEGMRNLVQRLMGRNRGEG